MDRNELLNLLSVKPKEVRARHAADDDAAPADELLPASDYALVLQRWDVERGERVRARDGTLQALPLGPDAIADFHASAYLLDPRLDDAPCVEPRRKDYVRTLLGSTDYKALHAATALQPLAAELATRHFAEEYAKLLTADARREERLRQNPGRGARERAALQAELRLLRAVGKAVAKAEEEVEEMHDMMGALGCGTGAGGATTLDPAKIADVFRRVRADARLRRICDLAGRYRRVAQGKQRRKVAHGYDDMIGVKLSDEVDFLLDEELVGLLDPDLEADTLRRLADGEALTLAYRGLETVGKGPIVVVVDECLHPSELVTLSSGWIKPISLVVAGDKVCSLDFASGATIVQEVARVAKVKSPAKLYHIQTSDGTIRCSGAHKFFVLVDGDVVEKAADQLVVDDRVAAVRRLPVGGDEKFDTDDALKFAQFLGYMLGDGHRWYCRARGSCYVAATDKDLMNLRVYADIVESLGYKPIIKCGDRNRLYVNSAALYRLIDSVYPNLLVKQPERKIDSVIQTWSSARLARFLRGFFDAESNVGGHQISVTSSSVALIDTLQLLLKRFGVVTERDFSASGFVDRSYHRLVISDRDSINAFAECIGYGSADKASSLRRVLARPRQSTRGRANTLRVCFQNVVNSVRRIGVRYVRGTQSCSSVSKDRLRRIVLRAEERLHYISSLVWDGLDKKMVRMLGFSNAMLTECGLTLKQIGRCMSGKSGRTAHYDCLLKWLKDRVACNAALVEADVRRWKTLCAENVYWTKVRSVVNSVTDTEFLYDLTMRGAWHNYIAGNLVVHNSGSMDGEPICRAKAFALAMGWVARHQNRWICFVGYSGGTDGNFLVMPPRKWDEGELLAWLSHFFSNGTSLDVPLDVLPRRWGALGCPVGKTDLIVISDALCHAPPTLVDAFNAWRKAQQVRCISLVINQPPGDLARVSDETYTIRTLGADEEAIERCLGL